ncbi:hypothetical protein B0H17DRAFT_1032963 [Mycena rosella]|uniref:Uncharacterized protein n=1 Tax=Mycena rosella TaxID=1033263 RepID=A0AAD7MA88_MYCRO|nr:hypothetical protein B0H17DRAFT_1032963 [Mycena rosella]
MDEYKAQRKNPLIRAESFVRSMSGMALIPPDPSYELVIYLRKCNSPGASLEFHDCSDAVDVPLNAWLDNLLLEPVDFDDLHVETGFDLWLSSECSLETGDYNDI